jgi:hypothetical protein
VGERGQAKDGGVHGLRPPALYDGLAGGPRLNLRELRPNKTKQNCLDLLGFIRQLQAET